MARLSKYVFVFKNVSLIQYIYIYEAVLITGNLSIIWLRTVKSGAAHSGHPNSLHMVFEVLVSYIYVKELSLRLPDDSS